MEVMKLFRTTQVLTSVLFLTSCVALDSLLFPYHRTYDVAVSKNSLVKKMPTPKFPTDEHRYHFTCCGWNGLHYLGFVYQLKRDERKMHQAAVYYALENAPDFEIVEWYSKKRKAAGKVRVIDSYPLSGGYCRFYQGLIQVMNKARTSTIMACKMSGSAGWSFDAGSYNTNW